MDRRRLALPPVLVLALAVPLATLVAGGWTLAIAGSGGLDTVGEAVRRTAQVQQTDLAADREAASRGLAGELRLEGGRLRFRGTDADVDAALAAAGGLHLLLEHPIDAGHDRTLALLRDGDAWTGPAFDASVGWRMALSPADSRWRLVGRWPRGGASLALRPAVDAADAPTMAPAAPESGDASR